MGDGARERVLAEHLRAENDHDLDGIMATFTPDATLVLNGQTFEGTDIIRRAHAALGFGDHGGFSDLHIAEVARHAAHGAIVLEERLSGRHTGTWEGLTATGRTFEVPLCTVYQFAADGRLAAEHVYFDSALLLRQLGVGR